ncbi:SWI/SNF-related matrix-associated actin-dependent regulator of chromatin subfamily A-like protein 1 [Argiope bruennichi]|uniref:SWI/SNF-related matrix-associated actin-dependent regulator of chromatin subfamily A-like protein 1 n=1 Tax=Argiope bruennichi TaxID=94029 RepID=UPI0024944816|nr:SWI/SNF-related matrix-associated actin-dependent regulator of chromatin subfamily A-like protein 1 [Argiope bruennichi]XP_055948897.1 SWI/SNF-related matrix-associated actin-dependent regulator of chromatin subfamily A-like protein 1 [Argiope bruennichi]
MSTLTEEQRKRIEENRRKAIERRAALSGAVNKNPSNSLSIASTANNTNGNRQIITSNNSSSIPKSVSPVFPNKYPNNALNQNKTSNLIPVASNSKNEKQVAKIFQSHDYVKGNCVLLNRKRFYVDMGYNKEVIEIFKAIPNRLYDMQTKKWNFLIEDHEKLMALLKPLQPNVLIVPLPRFILKIFSQVPETRTIKDYDLSTLDPVMLHSLLPFQKDGVKFGIQNEGRVLIADDMGLGKTIQAIAIANYYSNDWPLLVVTPSSVRYSWEQSFHTWLPSLDKAEISVINSGKDHIPNNKVILMSYDLLTKMKDVIVKRKFKSVIFDESHSLKNPKSARTKAAQEVIKNVKRIIMLSGTPALSRPIELYTQLSALRPREFFSYMEYGMRYCNGKQTPWGWDFNGSSNMGELQILLEETVMIRRLKSDVLQQLPSKFRQMILLDPSRISTKSKVLMAMSRKLQQESLKGMERRGVLLEYFHETGEVKLKAVCEYILDLLESDKKFICFAHHQNVINGICKVIEEKRIDYIRIDGSVSSEQRLKLCEKFQLNDSCKVAVLSITSANCGITLTAANLVVFAELFWNPGILTQAEDRAHRIGQQDNVVVQYLVAKGTADDEIWPLVQRKLDVLNKAGLSKDNFKSADTVLREQIDQPKLEDFWNELDKSLEGEWKLNCDIPEKRMKLVP